MTTAAAAVVVVTWLATAQFTDFTGHAHAELTPPLAS